MSRFILTINRGPASAQLFGVSLAAAVSAVTAGTRERLLKQGEKEQ
jgi:hypothetical protein